MLSPRNKIVARLPVKHYRWRIGCCVNFVIQNNCYRRIRRRVTSLSMASMSSSNRAIVVRMIMRENSIDKNIHGVTIYTLTVTSCSTRASRSTRILPFCVLLLSECVAALST